MKSSLVSALWFVCCLFLSPLPAHAQRAPQAEGPTQKRATATRIATGRITLDGKLDEAEWQSTPPADQFVQQQPREGAPATPEHQSEIRFLYDDEYLYIGATFYENEPNKLVVNELKRDFNARAGDLYVVVLDTFLDKLNAYNFQTNPGCALRDSQSYDDGRTINANWDGVWFCRSSVDGKGWYVEEAVPFKQLRFPRHDVQTWGLQVFRLIRHSNEQTVWNPVPRQFNQFKTSYAGLLEGIRDVKPGRNIRIKPFVIGENRRNGRTNDWNGDGGIDAKVGIRTNLVLDGTWRTDFSQVETDAQQINLTRFSLFFPEKREFFLENQGAFTIGPPVTNSNLVPFFSRTIGLSDTGSPIPIVGGARLTGKVGRSSLALLNMQTETEDRGPLAALPAANFTVLRYGREFLNNSSSSVFFMNKSRGGVSNQVFGADLRYYPTRQWNIDGLFMHSTKSGVGDDNSWRTGAQYDSGRQQITANLTSIGEQFRDDLGFVPRQGVLISSASFLQRVRPQSLAPHVREIRPTLAAARYTRDAIAVVTGKPIGVETAQIVPSVTIELADASTIDVSVADNEEFLSAPFRPQGIPAGKAIAAGRYQFWNQVISYEANNAKRIAPSLQFRNGDYYDGTRRGFTAGARYRLNEKCATTVSVSRDDITLPGGVAFDTTLATVRLDTSFSTRMFLNAFVQYNSVTHQVASNIRYDFIHRPLSDIFIVYNDARFVNLDRPTPAQVPTRALILKYTHLLSF